GDRRAVRRDQGPDRRVVHIDVESWNRAVQLAAGAVGGPGPGGKPIYEWLEVRPFLADSPTVTQ
ncbi:MAG TPA: hypothetical protein VIQ02_17045, partial [Jiangellaceae bacterium]